MKQRTERKLMGFLLTLALALALILGVSATAYASYGVNYIERAWNGTAVTETTQFCTNFESVDANTTTFVDGGWYVVNSTVTGGARITVNGTANLILCDGASLTGAGINITGTNTLNIYGQSEGTGTLTAVGPRENAGIGGKKEDATCGKVTIHGGKVNASCSSDWGAGIGGGHKGSGGNVTVYGGEVNATGGYTAAGIGGGLDGAGGDVNIYGGKVTANSGTNGAGIGGGWDGVGGTVSIYGGEVTAIGNGGGAGIGGGATCAGGTVNIYGGTVTASSARTGAGIGGGRAGAGGDVNIYGGTVTATGSTYNGGGAGIGGGAAGTASTGGGNGGNVNISGGTVTAIGGTVNHSTFGMHSGAGIGGGAGGGAIINNNAEIYNGGKGGTVTITGGTVTATGGADAVGIGGGDGNTDNGTLKVAAACGTYSDDSSITDANKYYSDDMTQGAGDTAVNIIRNRYMVTQEDTVPQVYPLWVGSTRVNAQIASNITGGSTATASYDASTNTLTLNGANLSGEGHTVIDGQNQLTRHYAVLYNGAESLNLVLSGTNSLACTGDRQGDVYFGIRSNRNLTISGTGSAGVNGRDTGIIVGSINTPADLVIAGGSVTVQQNKGDAFEIYGNMQIGEGAGTVIAETAGTHDAGIHVNGSNGLTVNGGSLTATGGEAGIRTLNGPVVIGNSCAVVAAGDTQGIEGTVKNAIDGFGWTDVGGTTGRAEIPVNTTTGQTLTDFKKVQFPVDPVSYLDWDATKKELVEKTGDEACKTYTVVTAGTTAFEDGKWYVVEPGDSAVEITSRITVNGTANLILMDGATLNASKGINAPGGTLTIFAQSVGSNAGALTASVLDDDAIGADKLTINGGNITASVGTAAAKSGIAAYDLTINGGTVTVSDNNKGNYGIYGGTAAVVMNGGTVNVKGAHNGIYAQNCPVTINGGSLTATGSNTAVNAKGDVTINGGSVSANVTGNEGDGIRSEHNVIINGGSVTARGNGAANNSGICATLDLTISNGAVVNASGFGHGLYSGQAAVTINGGSVEASGSSSGIFAKNNAVINGGIVIVTGDTNGAFYSDGNKTTHVANAIPGTGWTDTEGTTGEENIAISSTAQTLSFKKVKFPATHIHDNIDFTAWSSTDSLPDSGSWYLTGDVTLTDTWNVPDDAVNLCLNGHKITMQGSKTVISVAPNRTLNLHDCGNEERYYYLESGLAHVTSADDSAYTGADENKKGTFTGGYITGGDGGIKVSGTLHLYAGSIVGNAAENDGLGGGVSILSDWESTGTFIMDGGSIIGNIAEAGGGVYVKGYSAASRGTFVMNGGEVRDNAVSSTKNSYGGGGVYVDVHGTFTMSDGSILRNNSQFPEEYTYTGNPQNGGGVLVNSGIFNMSGGSITGNKVGQYCSGGGVCLANYSSVFNMSGGSITENHAEVGGGVYSNAYNAETVTGTSITGGSIRNNTADYGGGVFANDTILISGSPVITDNTAKGAPSNVHLKYNSYIRVNGALTDTASVGVTMAQPGVFTTNSTDTLKASDYIERFTSDDSTYSVLKQGNELALGVAYPLWVGGVQVTSLNKDDVLGAADGDGATVKFTPATTGSNPQPAKLTLNGANLSGEGASVQSSLQTIHSTLLYDGEEALVVELTGSNSISCEGTKIAPDVYMGIYSKGDLTINGSGSLTAGAKDTALGTAGNLQLNGSGSLTLTGGAAYAIKAEGNIEIGENAGSITATSSGTGAVYSSGTSGLTANGGDLDFTSSDDETCAVNLVGGALTIGENVTRFIAAGPGGAIDGTVKNAIDGTGWSDTAGTMGEEDIAISGTAQSLSFKKVKFPATHIHDNIDFTAWRSTDSLPDSGSYYLTDNVTVNETTGISGTLNLCLNGKTISYTGSSGSVFYIPVNTALNLYDCAETSGVITGGMGNFDGSKTIGGNVHLNGGTFNLYGGTLTGGTATQGGGVFAHGSFNMYGGSITGGTATHGGGVFVDGSFELYDGTISNNAVTSNGGGVYSFDGSFVMHGGTISGNSAAYYGGGVYDSNNTFDMRGGTISGNSVSASSTYNGGGVYITGTAKLSGNAVIQNNTKGSAANNAYFNIGGNSFNITGALTDGASIGVTMRTPGVITTGAAFDTDEAAQAVFFSDSTAYSVAATGDRQAQLMHNTHSFTYAADGATVTATCTAAGGCTLPEEGGKHIATLTINEPTLKTYGQTGQGISPEVTITDEHGIQGQATVAYYNTNDAHTGKTGQPLASAPTDAGTYWVEITLGSGDNTATAHLIYTIAKADSTAATVSYSPIVYDESEHPLVTVDESTLVGGEMRYALGTDSQTAPTSWSTSIPTGTDGGIYYVWYKVEGDANHNDTEPVCVEVTIGYSITYDANGGTGAPAEQGKVKDMDIILATEIPTRYDNGVYVVNFEPNGGTMTGKVTYAQHRTYYSFLGWNTEKDGSGTSYAPGAVYTANEGATLYAQWAKSGEATASIPLPTPVLEGYVFQGWTLDPEEGTVMTGRYTPEGATTLYALWKIGTYTVSFDTDGGTEIAAITGEYGTPITTVPEAPTKRGYTFKSWDKPIPETIPGEDMVIKAIYEALPFGEADFILPASLTVIEEEAFEGAGVKTVYVPETVERIEANAFRDCAQLEKIRLPKDCEIDDTAFDGCKNLLVYAPAGGKTDEFCDAQGILFIPEPAK